MANQGGINGTAITAALVGSVLVYSAVKGNTISVTLRNFLAGHGSPDNFGTGAFGVAGSGLSAGRAGADAPPSSHAPGGNQFSKIQGFMLSTAGFTKAGTAGALGNIQVESKFDPTSYNPGEGAIGICQWEGPRRTALQAFAGAKGTTETDIDTQLQFMLTELTTSRMPVYLYMRGTSDPSSAAAFWDQYYEVSAGTTRAARISNAQAIYAQMGG